MYIATYFNKDLRQLKNYPKEKPSKKQMREKKEIIEGHKIEVQMKQMRSGIIF